METRGRPPPQSGPVSDEIKMEQRPGKLTFDRTSSKHVRIEMTNSMPPREAACYGGSSIRGAVEAMCEEEIHRHRETLGQLCFSVGERLSDEGTRMPVQEMAAGTPDRWPQKRFWERRSQALFAEGMTFKASLMVEEDEASDRSILNQAVHLVCQTRERQDREFYRRMMIGTIEG